MLISKEVENTRESGRAKLLLELTPVQRSEATKAIGKTFSFREVP
jgi:hypothetical protein